MRHFFAVIIIGVLLTTGLGAYYNRQIAQAQESVAATITVADVQIDTIQVGILSSSADSMDDIYFRKTVKANMPDNCNLHVTDCNGDVETQMAMFRKMLFENYSLIFLDVFDPSVIDACTELAMHQNTALVFMGEPPTAEQLAAWDRLYYLGAAGMDPYTSLSDAVSLIWSRARSMLDKDLDDTLKYAALSGTPYDNTTNQLHFETPLTKSGIPLELTTDAVMQSFSYDLNAALAGIAESGTELLICENSSDAYQAWQYYHDPEVYEIAPAIEIVVAAMDDGVQSLIDDGSVLAAAGYDGELMGEAGAKLCVAILTGQEITRETVGVEPAGNSIVCANTVLVSKRVEAYILSSLNTQVSAVQS